MKALAAPLLALCLLCGCSSLKLHEQAAVADVGLTSIGLALGAVEVNPLGWLTVPLKYAATQHIKTLPDGERQYTEGVMKSYWSGAAVNNACVILAIVTQGVFAPACIIPGLIYAGVSWEASANERLFWQMCANEKLINPELTCEYKGIL